MEGLQVTQPGDLIDQLRRIRVNSGVAQFDLAETAGYNRSTIARYEAGGYVTEPLHMLCNWAEALGYDLALVKK